MDKRVQSDWRSVLGVTQGIICAVGAGGKKTLLNRIASETECRLALTSTTQMPPAAPAFSQAEWVVAGEELCGRVVQALETEQKVAYAHPSPKRGRVGQVSRQEVEEIHRAAALDISLVKADGARGRLIKCPKESEPVIPGACALVLAVVAFSAIGRELNESVAHRPELVSKVTGCPANSPLEAAHLVELFASPRGAFWNSGQARRIAVLSQVDSAADWGPAESLAREVLSRNPRIEKVLITSIEEPCFIRGEVAR